jgi:hypothetical protein
MIALAPSNGMIVAGRFELEAQIRRDQEDGLYRARDLHRNGQPIALRMLWADSHTQEAESFLQGARMLMELRHPGLETYVAHGRISEGQRMLFLATEWIEGEFLEDRLRSRPLRTGESLVLVRAVAEALAVAHEQGLAHGDLRPGCLLLPSTQEDQSLEQVVLTGFGVVSRNPAWITATASHPIVEALRYVAPEQARGWVRRSPSADVFSLGCVLLECLTGTPPFGGQHSSAVLAQILFQELPPLRQRHPELPEALAQLVQRMLAKRPEERPRDGRVVLALLERIGLTSAQLGHVAGAPSTVLAVGERRLLCLVLARPREMAVPAGGLMEAAATAPQPPVPSASPLRPHELEELRTSFGAQIDPLLDGSLVALVRQGGQTMMDVAAQAARLALALRARLPSQLPDRPAPAPLQWQLALAAGQGVDAGTQLVDEVLARAMALLETPAPPGEGHPGGPWLDELSARLLDLRFQVHPAEGGRALLVGERSGRDELRPLLGTVTPCLGRERELELLERWIEQSFEEPMAQAFLVTAPSGVGKSRLRQEFVRRLEERGTRVAIWIGRGDPMRAGTAYGILGLALRELCGIRGAHERRDETHGAEQRARFGERVGRHLLPVERPQVVEFLGELCGLPFSDNESARLRTARQDPRSMSEQVTSVFLRFLAAECEHKPVLLILEDLHWSDVATLRLIEVALRELDEQPLAVLGLARPELKELFPRLWGERRTQELRLQGLHRKASAALVQHMLGTRVPPETAERIVLQAGGNALFLEELIRAVAEGREGELPETVLAMLQARFERLGAMAQRVVRMAALLGDSFWSKGVYALLGGERHEKEIERALRSLVDDEVLVLRNENRAPGATGATGDRLFAFRHSLLREAAYGLMSEEDRRLGHRLVAAYLERSGESDPGVLAEHYQRGGRPERAAAHFARAARQALATIDLEGALARVARGVACGAHGELLGTLRAIATWGHLWLGDLPAASQAMNEALELLSVGSADWLSMQGAAVALSAFQGQRVAFSERIGVLAAAPLLPGAEQAFLEPAAMAIAYASILGMRDTAAAFLEQLRKVYRHLDPPEPRAQGMLGLGLLWYELLLVGDLWAYASAAHEAAGRFAEAGDRRNADSTQAHSGIGLILLGEVEQGRARCVEMLGVLERSREPMELAATQALCAMALAEMGGPDAREHRSLTRTLAQAASGYSQLPPFWAGLARAALAIVWTDEGALDAAEVAAREALRILAGAPAGLPLACALLGRILLAQGRLQDAEVAVNQGLAQLAVQGGAGLLDTKLHLVSGELWRALGQATAAREAFERARRALAQHAAQIPESAARQRFLDRSREHAWLRGAGGGECETR